MARFTVINEDWEKSCSFTIEAEAVSLHSSESSNPVLVLAVGKEVVAMFNQWDSVAKDGVLVASTVGIHTKKTEKEEVAV